MTAPTPTSGDSGYSRFMRLDFLVAAGDSCISPRESEQYTALLEFWRVVVARTAAAEEIQSCGGHRQLPSFPRPGPFDFAQGRLARRPSPHERATITTMSLQEYKRKRRFE